MRHYEVTFIVDPVLSGDEIKSTAHTYVDLIKSEDCQITHVDETGLRPLAYPINKRHSGIYFTIEFSSEMGALIDRLELALRRDERIMRFLTVALDKFGVKYNDDKRNGLIGKGRKDKSKTDTAPVAAAPVAAAPVAAAPVAAAPVAAAPVAADPVVADPVAADPVVADPVVADPVAVDPVVVDPVVADPVAADPVAAPEPVPPVIESSEEE